MTTPGPAPLRVLQVIDSIAPGGAEHALIDLVAGLRARGHAVDVAALGPPPTLASQFQATGARTFQLGSGRRWDAGVARRLVRLSAGYDVVHAHLFMAEFYVAVTRLASPRVARVATLHNLGYDENVPTTLPQRARRQLHRRVLTRAFDAWTAVSAPVAQSYARHLGLGSIDVVPNAFSLPPDAPGPNFDAGAFRAGHGVDVGPLVVSVGRLTPQKGHAGLIDAVERLGRADVTVAIVGDGPLRDALAARIAERGPATVRLLGAVPRAEVLRWIAAADAFVLPSIHEAFGVVLLEAMSLGRPIVATATGGVPSIVEDERSALLVPPGAPARLASALVRLLADPALAARLAAAARADAAERFGQAAVATAFEAVYRRARDRRAGA